jgi:hypothetical protein
MYVICNALQRPVNRPVISPHQDVFSRFISGSGAPYWALEAVGLNPRRIHQTGAGVIHSAWETQGMGGEEGIKTAKEGKAGPWPDSEYPCSSAGNDID